jgi:hypothetical protein
LKDILLFYLLLYPSYGIDTHLIDIIWQNETEHMHPSFGSRIARDRDMVQEIGYTFSRQSFFP